MDGLENLTPEQKKKLLELLRKGQDTRPSEILRPQQPLTTGPITWDEESIKRAQLEQPAAQMRQFAPYMVPGIGLLGGLGMNKGLLNLLRDPRLEMMFRGLR